jgi:hypothetical protein
VLGADLASAYARVALANVRREYPRRLDQLMIAADTQWRPRVLHPAFFGSYDWHSAVHMHWLLARLLRLHPSLPEERDIAALLERHLSLVAIRGELAFFNSPGGATFERPYGWAWLLELRAELLRLNKWHKALEPLAGELARRFETYVKRLPYPVRAGTHGNSAFACVLALDYAMACADAKLKREVEAAARRWYLADQGYPVAYEPSGDDFLSPALVEAVLMKQVLDAREFPAWLTKFLPALGPLAEPPRVIDHHDAKQSHLDGLCLSRAWCFQRLGLHDLFETHVRAGLPQVIGGDYAGEHWLATFATLALSAEALRVP